MDNNIDYLHVETGFVMEVQFNWEFGIEIVLEFRDWILIARMRN